MPKGFYKRTKPPWNKGIPRTKEEKQKMSESKKGHYIGSKNPNWKGGITKIAGRVYVYCPNHPNAVANRVKRAHLVMEKKIGRYLKPEEQVHHKGTKYPLGSIENKQDDRPENLQLFANCARHSKFHYKFRKRNKDGTFNTYLP